MEGFAKLYRDGYLGIIQGVGSPIPDQSHERALRMWHTADPQRPQRQTGWLGRVADRARRPAAPDNPAIFVGPIPRPFALNAENVVVPSIRSAQDLILRRVHAPDATQPSSTGLGPQTGDMTGPEGTGGTLLQFLRHSDREARIRSERIEAAITTGGGSADYPPFGLARDLGTVARLIRADIGLRIFFVELGGGGIGGFDNHANQLGNHCALLHQLAQSVAAFVYDLKRDRQLDRVLLMTFSEFGRSVRENGRRGTDHGIAAPLFLVGGRVKGGLAGSHPSLTDLDQGALKTRIDFRRVYVTVLDRWLGFGWGPQTSTGTPVRPSEAVLGGRFEPLDVLQG